LKLENLEDARNDIKKALTLNAKDKALLAHSELCEKKYEEQVQK